MADIGDRVMLELIHELRALKTSVNLLTMQVVELKEGLRKNG